MLTNQLRAAVAGRSGYYKSKTLAVKSVEDELNGRGYSFDDPYNYDWSGSQGSSNVPFWLGFNARGDADGYVHFSWYTMPSGCIELTVYIAL